MANVGKALRKFTTESLETLSKGFGKFSDDEAKLFQEVKEKLGKGSKEYDDFVNRMSSARKQNSLDAYKGDKTSFADRKEARIQQNQQRQQEKMQAQYNKYSTGEYDRVTSSGAEVVESGASSSPDYSGAKGRKDVTREMKMESKNLPATPEQLQQSNQGFNDMMSGAAHDAGAPRANDGPNYRQGKGRKDSTETWESSKRKSWERNASTTEVSNGRGDIEVYVDPETRRAQAIDDLAERHLKQKTLENANKTGWERVKDAASDVWAGSGFNKQTTANRRAYNEHLHSQGSNEYIKSNREFQRMQSNMGIHGTYTGQAEGFDALNRAQGRADAAAKAAAEAEAAAKAEEFSQWWAGKKDGIATFAKENPMITAAGIAGTAIVGASLLDND